MGTVSRLCIIMCKYCVFVHMFGIVLQPYLCIVLLVGCSSEFSVLVPCCKHVYHGHVYCQDFLSLSLSRLRMGTYMAIESSPLLLSLSPSPPLSLSFSLSLSLCLSPFPSLSPSSSLSPYLPLCVISIQVRYYMYVLVLSKVVQVQPVSLSACLQH